MTLSTDACIAAIEKHSAGFAAAARGNLAAHVEHCPDWDVADLVRHLTDVHWLWATIAEERLSSPPDEEHRPAHVADASLVDAFESGARRLVEVLRGADQRAACWTWAPHQQDVAFITRHQVQEAAVHHWDAAHAAGQSVDIDPDVAADAVTEFLTFSVSSDADPMEPAPSSLGTPLVLRATDTGDAWTLGDGQAPGTTRWLAEDTEDAPHVEAAAADLLLWLYGRVNLQTTGAPDDLVERFRRLCYTD
jgi:uncharacterized protein (TIGR03083 family)